MPWHPVRLLRVIVTLMLLGVAGCVAAPGPQGYGTVGFERRIVSAVTFNFDSYQIRGDNYALLDNAAIALNDPQLGGLRFEINGHTDITGRLGYNIGLSMLRATAVLDYLAARGVARERMLAQGFGPLQPFDAYNPRSPASRRVEIVALY